MKNFRILIIFSALLIRLNAQDFSLYRDIPGFTNASAFSLSQFGYIYIADRGTDEIYQLDSLGNSLKSAGGYGWAEGCLDNPCDIFSSSLRVYVADRNNHRIQIFDKDLNFLSTFSNLPEEISGNRFFPRSCKTSAMGDLFILDEESKCILKYDLQGNFSLKIGGTGSEKYSLDSPSAIALLKDSGVLVTDANSIKYFDRYGSPLLRLKLDIEPINISSSEAVVTICSKDSVKIFSPGGFGLRSINFENKESDPIVQAVIDKKNLYVLFPNHLSIFRQKN